MPEEKANTAGKEFHSKREFERTMFPQLAERHESPKDHVDRVSERLIEVLRQPRGRTS